MENYLNPYDELCGEVSKSRRNTYYANGCKTLWKLGGWGLLLVLHIEIPLSAPHFIKAK